jgi:hypothetical protein
MSLTLAETPLIIEASLNGSASEEAVAVARR